MTTAGFSSSLVYSSCPGSLTVLGPHQAALEAREGKLQDSWKAIRGQATATRKEMAKVRLSALSPPVLQCSCCSPELSRESGSGSLSSLSVVWLQGNPAHLALLKEDAAAAAEIGGISTTSGRALEALVDSDTVAEAAEALEDARAALAERETALQRWAITLELEVGCRPHCHAAG